MKDSCAKFLQRTNVGLGYCACTDSFDISAYSSCDSRKYAYFFPTYLLLPPKPNTALANVLKSAPSTAQTQSVSPQSTFHPFWDAPTITHEDELARKRTWRVGSNAVEALRATAKKYEGTHNFHNFTVGREFSDRSNQRHMLSIEVRFILG